jgi:hypothetical protein
MRCGASARAYVPYAEASLAAILKRLGMTQGKEEEAKKGRREKTPASGVPSLTCRFCLFSYKKGIPFAFLGERAEQRPKHGRQR